MVLHSACHVTFCQVTFCDKYQRDFYRQQLDARDIIVCDCKDRSELKCRLNTSDSHPWLRATWIGCHTCDRVQVD